MGQKLVGSARTVSHGGVEVLDAADVEKRAEARGLSADQARTCLADAGKIEAMVETSSAKAEEVGVTGTPTFTLNDRKLDENQWPGLEPILQRAGAREASE